MNLADTIHQCFRVGKGDCPDINDAIPVDRMRMRIAALLEDPDTIHEYFAELDLIAWNMALAALIEKGAVMPLDSLRSDLLDKGIPCLDDQINQAIEHQWALAEDDRKYGDFDERRAMA